MTQNILIKDFVPFEVAEIIPDNILVQLDENEQIRTHLTEECLYYILGTAAFRKVVSLKRLKSNCVCSALECRECLESTICVKEISITPSDLKMIFEWVDLEATIREGKIGKEVDLEWINRFIAIDFKTMEKKIFETMLWNRIRHYMTHPTQREETKQLLFRRLLHIAQFPLIGERLEEEIEHEIDDVIIDEKTVG